MALAPWFKWENKNKPLLDQVREGLAADPFGDMIPVMQTTMTRAEARAVERALCAPRVRRVRLPRIEIVFRGMEVTEE